MPTIFLPLSLSKDINETQNRPGSFVQSKPVFAFLTIYQKQVQSKKLVEKLCAWYLPVISYEYPRLFRSVSQCRSCLKFQKI